LEYYAAKIRARWSQDNASILRLATLCLRADQVCEVHDRRALIAATGIGKQSFSKLISIAAEPRFLAHELRRKLPNNLYALDAIRKLTDYQILVAIEFGIVGPNSSEWAIKRWLGNTGRFQRNILERMVVVRSLAEDRDALLKELAIWAFRINQEEIHGPRYKNCDWHMKQFEYLPFHGSKATSSAPTSSSL
jgi:hypothetical protein